MAGPGVLEHLVSQISWQIKRRRAEYYGLRGTFYGAILGVIPLVLKEVLGSYAPLIALGAVVAGASAGVLWGVALSLPVQDVARILDRAFGLRDRVATALEWAGRPGRSPLVDLLVTDVTIRLEGLDGRRVIPSVWPRELKLLPLPALLMVVLAFAPSIPLPAGGLPAFLSRDGSETQEERAGKALSEERSSQTAREDLRAEAMGRNFALGQRGLGGGQPGDLAALFKDTALSDQQPDFNSFLKKGDERLRLLEKDDRLPDLQRDFTRSPYKVVFRKKEQLLAGLRPDQLSPEKLRELLEEMERMGRKGGSWGGDIDEGMDALNAGATDRALQAMEKALSKMRSMEERRRRGRGLQGGREEGRRGGRDGDPGAGLDDTDPDFGFGDGLLPGSGRNPNPTGNATERLRSSPFDSGVEGQTRAGRKEGYDTNLFGKGAEVPSRLQYMKVFAKYRTMMEEAMVREQVPRDYQSQVKTYFESLEERR